MMAEGLERGEWHRAALIASAASGAPMNKLLPRRFRIEPKPVPVNEGDSRRGWRMLGTLIGAPPKED
jgi:hypothetical protein